LNKNMMLKELKSRFIEKELKEGYEKSKDCYDSFETYRKNWEGAKKKKLTKLNETTANGITNCIDTYCKLIGAHFNRIQSQGQYRPGHKIISGTGILRKETVTPGTWTRGTTRKGTFDAEIIHKGKVIKVEIKAGKDRLSEYQKQYMADLQAQGIICLIARDFENFSLELCKVLEHS
jgi:hypothetical protein